MEEIMRFRFIRIAYLLSFFVLAVSFSGCSRQTSANVVLEEPWISRAVALRAVALALTDRDTCLGASRFYFTQKSQTSWYAPYFSWLYERGIIDFEEILPTEETAQGKLLCKEARRLLESLNLSEVASRYLQVGDEEALSPTLWWMIYQEILDSYNRLERVQQQNIKIWGTPQNITGISEWEVCTNQGIYHFEGLALDAYVDTEVKALVRGNSIIHIFDSNDSYDLQKKSVTYENVWLGERVQGEREVLLSGAYRKLEDVSGENVADCLADIQVKGGKIVVINPKTEEISGRLLAVGDDFVKVKGYGTISLDGQIQIYDLSQGMGTVSSMGREELTAGMKSLHFVLSGGVCCGILKEEEDETQNIRVLICTDGWTSYYHSQVILTSQEQFIVTTDEQTKTYAAGEIVTLNCDTVFSQDETILVQSLGESGIQVLSVNREQGNPTYEGILEISKRDEGLLLVNELPLETYLTYVVPSEMPASYGIEAAKVQAVCARSYAWRHMHSGSCGSYGAHVDDSTAYQVYNNIAPQEVSTQGVWETEGEVLTQDGEIISAYYFSTSCGSTTDMRSWGSSDEGGMNVWMVTASEETLDLADEEVFETFIKNWNYDAWELGQKWYRWRCELSMEELTNLVAERLPELMQSMPDVCFTEDETGNLRPLTEKEVGAITQIHIVKRLEGGIVDEIQLVGEKQTIRVEHQTAIRTLLGDGMRMYTSNLENEMSQSESELLPSAFFCVEASENGIVLYGGGNGHGIGLSQSGAYAMTLAGMDYQTILGKFYAKAQLTTLSYMDE